MYPVPRIAKHRDYIDVPEKGVQVSNQDKKVSCVKDPNPSSQVTKGNSNTTEEVIMTDHLAKHAPVLKGKKLAWELKTYLKKVSERLFMHIMNQEVQNITIQELLRLFLLVHKMMFQNLPAKMFEDEVVV